MTDRRCGTCFWADTRTPVYDNPDRVWCMWLKHNLPRTLSWHGPGPNAHKDAHTDCPVWRLQKDPALRR